MKNFVLNKDSELSLCINDLNASYGKNIILSNCNLQLKKSVFYCLCGPNGSGKSTLLSILASVNDDALKVFDCNNKKNEPYFQTKEKITLSKFSKKQLATLISFLQQDEYSVWDFCVKDYVLQGRFCHTQNGSYSQEDKMKAFNAMNELGITSLSEKSVHCLSGGEFQKVKIARSLCQGTPFILLDEPSSSLDFVYEAKLLEKLKDICHKKNKAILVSIHDINLALRYCDQLCLLKKGDGLICGKPTLSFVEKNIPKLYESECSVYEHPIFHCPQIFSL